MATDPRAPSSDPGSPQAPAPRRRPWVAPLVAVVVLAVIGVAGVQVWRFMHPPQTATTKPAPPRAAAPRVFAVDGTVSRTPKDGQKELVKDATIVVVQPAWTSEQQQAWEQRVNEKVAGAWREVGGNDPAPKVTADPASVRRGDETIARKYQTAKPATPWNHQCTTEFLALLKESAVEAGRATTGADGAFSIQVAPPAGMPYIVHAQAGSDVWVDTLRRGSNRVDLNDTNRAPD